MPEWVALAAIVLVLLDVGSIVALVTTGALEGLWDSLPSYQERLVLLSAQFGAFLMMIPAVLLALVQTDIQTALLVALGYLTVNTVIGSILEPRIMGRGLGISTLAVFLSLLLWSWVLGTVGAFLSVPLTMAIIVVLEASAQTRPIAILLGPELARKTEPDEETSSGGGAADRDPGSP